uniref:BED-type domain-containing protein n=1 Tax=Lactuca sativa TaxID=4236 RepID=A0A9R1VD86_LACSA|nr:hypothetical protein LSAT_V11C500297630 [Lactuca sativa]
MFLVMLITSYLSFCNDIQDQQTPQRSVEVVGTVDGQLVGTTDGEGARTTDAEAAETTNKRLTFEVWRHFKKQKIDGVDKAICNYCKKKSSGISKDGTTHLHEHYKKCLSKNNRDIRQSMLNPRQEKKDGLVSLGAHTFDQNVSREELAKMIILHEFMYVPALHNAKTLTKALMGCLVAWSIVCKLYTLTLDNCSVNFSMMEKMKEKLRPDNLILKGKLFHMQCCAHILNLIIQQGLSAIQSGIESIRESVVFWTATPKRVENFEETKDGLSLPSKRKLVLVCKTRWNSTYLMLMSVIPYKEVLNRLVHKDKSYKQALSDHDWLLAKVMCEKLKLFYSVTKMFSRVKYPIANLFFPKIYEIRMLL